MKPNSQATIFFSSEFVHPPCCFQNFDSWFFSYSRMCMVNLNVLNHLLLCCNIWIIEKNIGFFHHHHHHFVFKWTCLPPKCFFSMVFFAHGHFIISRLNLFWTCFHVCYKVVTTCNIKAQLTSCLCFSFQVNLPTFLLL
jgi:hypothetical protein